MRELCVPAYASDLAARQGILRTVRQTDPVKNQSKLLPQVRKGDQLAAMTCKEFANKYNIPYHIAYAATYKVKPVSSMMRDRDYVEEELKTAVEKLLEYRIKKNTAILEEQKKALMSLRKA